MFLKMGFKYAVRGLINMFQSERNFKVQIVLLVLTIVAAIFFQISPAEWCIILIFGAMMLAVETLNSVIEKLCDFIQPEQHPKIKWIKDTSASAALIVAFFAAIAGAIIFVPKFFSLFVAL